jgi:hypothetical protein
MVPPLPGDRNRGTQPKSGRVAMRLTKSTRKTTAVLTEIEAAATGW